MLEIAKQFARKGTKTLCIFRTETLHEAMDCGSVLSKLSQCSTRCTSEMVVQKLVYVAPPNSTSRPCDGRLFCRAMYPARHNARTPSRSRVENRGRDTNRIQWKKLFGSMCCRHGYPMALHESRSSAAFGSLKPYSYQTTVDSISPFLFHRKS